MMIVALQLNDWGKTSANQTIALVTYLKENYNIENIYKFADSLACETKLNEPMKKHTSFKIGGNAAVYIKVDSLSKLCKFVREMLNLQIQNISCSVTAVIYL